MLKSFTLLKTCGSIVQPFYQVLALIVADCKKSMLFFTTILCNLVLYYPTASKHDAKFRFPNQEKAFCFGCFSPNKLLSRSSSSSRFWANHARTCFRPLHLHLIRRRRLNGDWREAMTFPVNGIRVCGRGGCQCQSIITFLYYNLSLP